MSTRAVAVDGSIDDLGAAARRGLVYIPLAKAWFLIAGLGMTLLLPRVFGSPSLFGVWMLVAAWVSAPNNVIVTATIQAVSHFTAKGSVEEAKRAALRMNTMLGVGLAAGLFFLAPLIASFEHDHELVLPLRLSAAVVLLYSFYAVFVGSANGERQFHKQAGLDVMAQTLRAGLVLLGAGLWHAMIPAMGGWVLASAICFLVSVVWVGLPSSKSTENAVPVGRMIGYIRWLIFYLSAINVQMFVDGWWLKRLCTEAAGSGADVKRSVDALVGVYGAAQSMARLPYQLILAGAFVIFPLLSVPELQADRARVRQYVTATLRYALVAMLGAVVALGVRPEATLRLVFKPEYSTAAPALAILLSAYVCFSLLSIIGTMTNSLGYTVETMLLGVLGALGTGLSVYLSVKNGLAAGEQPLRAAALGMLIGMGGGLLMNLVYLYARLRATLPVLTLLRVGLALAISLSIGRFWPAPGTAGLLGSKLGTLLCSGVAVVVYLVVIFATRELSIAELKSARRKPATGAVPA